MINDARQFAHEWIEAWNSHDLDSIMSHYADDVEFSSPFVVRIMSAASGTIRGKDVLRNYIQKGLGHYPDLHFELYNVLSGVNSVTLYYRSVKNLIAAEVMIFDKQGKIAKVLAHYSDASTQ